MRYGARAAGPEVQASGEAKTPGGLNVNLAKDQVYCTSHFVADAPLITPSCLDLPYCHGTN